MSEVPLPPIDECPVLADAVREMKVDFAVNNSGEIYVFHEKPFKETINWIEYYESEQRICFVTDEGRIQGLGMTIPKVIADQITTSNRVFLIHVENGKAKTMLEVSFIKQS